MPLNPDPEELQYEFVDPELREAVRNFDDASEAEIAAGFLRAQGIPAQVGSLMIPGLTCDLTLWVRRDDAEQARQLLDEADAAARGPQAVE